MATPRCVSREDRVAIAAVIQEADRMTDDATSTKVEMPPREVDRTTVAVTIIEVEEDRGLVETIEVDWMMDDAAKIKVEMARQEADRTTVAVVIIGAEEDFMVTSAAVEEEEVWTKAPNASTSATTHSINEEDQGLVVDRMTLGVAIFEAGEDFVVTIAAVDKEEVWKGALNVTISATIHSINESSSKQASKKSRNRSTR